jgi:gamma-glutamylcyclotransferase (GGCT)/AIG2-like uncharacterized protein YtfP
MAELFVYGTLMEPDVRRDVIGRTVRTHRDLLRGYRMSSMELGGHVFPCIIEDASQGEPIEGLRLEIDDNDLKRLDKYETSAYQRTEVRLASGRKAWVYVASKGRWERQQTLGGWDVRTAIRDEQLL